MAKNSRNGERDRYRRQHPQRIPALGYYSIVTDAEETEKNYFYGLRDHLAEAKDGRIVIKVIDTKTSKMIEAVRDITKYDPHYRENWIIFDRDRVQDFDQIIQQAEQEDIRVGWSNPCFEIWMHAYFGKMPEETESVRCVQAFGQIYKRKTGREYRKSGTDIYDVLLKHGDEKQAIALAKTKHQNKLKNRNMNPSQMVSCTTVYLLVEEITGKTNPR